MIELWLEKLFVDDSSRVCLKGIVKFNQFSFMVTFGVLVVAPTVLTGSHFCINYRRSTFLQIAHQEEMHISGTQ